MTDIINELTDKKLKKGIEKLVDDCSQYYNTHEYNLNPDVVRCSCDIAYQTNRIQKDDYERYIKIIKQIKIYRNIQGSNSRSEASMNKYINDMIFWS